MTVTISETEYCYPDFKEGQVLTHNDLNTLRDYLYTKFAFHGRALIGFGVACGLDGTLAGSTLTLTPGFALAQGGRELIVSAPDTADLNALSLDTTVYSFVETGPGGVTAILRATETVEEAGGECTSEGCTTHTELHCEGAEIVFVAGRLNLGANLGNPVFALQPIVPKTNPSLTGFAPLRDALYTALNGLVDNDTRNLLKALTLSGPKGIDLLKAGIVNEVLYTLWDYYQCKANESAPCGGYTGAPAVALGWASRSGSTWAWDCRYRHHFQLALPLYRGVHGFRCEDICDRYLDRIRELVQDFTPPVIPDPGGKGSDPGTVDICTISDIKLGRCRDWWGQPHEQYPPKQWIDPTKERDPRPWFTDPGDPAPWESVLGGDPWETVTQVNSLDPVQSGVISSHSLLGSDGPLAENAVKQAITDVGIDATVTTMPMEQFNTMQQSGGLQQVLVAAASDAITLGTNADGVVVAMGVVPTAKTLGGVSAIRATANYAHETASGAALQVNGALQRMDVVEKGFTDLNGSFGGLEQKFETFSTNSTKQFGDFRVELTGEWQSLRESLPATGLLQKAADLGEQFGGLEQQVAQYGQQLQTHEATLERLDTNATQLTGRLDTMSQRIDRIVVPGAATAGTTAGTINTAIFETLSSMSKAIAAGSTKRAGPAVRQQLANVAPQLSVLQRETVSSTHLAAAEPVALANVVEGMMSAIAATGLSADAPEMKDLQASVTLLKGQLGIG
ncbi:MAG: hypothetical protein ACXVZ4_12335 [Gaiellaceae bacterium]